MPSFSFWLSGAALFLAGSFAFTVVVGLIGIRELVQRRTFAAFVLVAIILSGLAWYTAAAQEQTSKALGDSLNSIADYAKISKTQSAQSLADAIIRRLAPMERQVNTLTATAKARKWRALDPQQESALIARLKEISAQRIGIACATPACKELADQLAHAFRRAGWTPVPHHGGGMGVDGVTGIVVDSCNGTSRVIKIAIEEATGLGLDAHEDVGCAANDFLVVGEKPF